MTHNDLLIDLAEVKGMGGCESRGTYDDTLSIIRSDPPSANNDGLTFRSV